MSEFQDIDRVAPGHYATVCAALTRPFRTKSSDGSMSTSV
jgi:hypothetical protein